MIYLERIRILMQRHGIKQYELAEKIGIKERTLRDKLKGKTEFTIGELRTIADILKIALPLLLMPDENELFDPLSELEPEYKYASHFVRAYHADKCECQHCGERHIGYARTMALMHKLKSEETAERKYANMLEDVIEMLQTEICEKAL